MYRRVGLSKSDEGYLLKLTPAQFELARRVVVDLYGGHSSGVIAVVAGGSPPEILELRDREVDFSSRESVDVSLGDAGLRALFGALSFAYLSCSSEEAFHHRYGFYSENVQAVGWALLSALREMDDSAA